jgi:hypothetical protein
MKLGSIFLAQTRTNVRRALIFMNHTAIQRTRARCFSARRSVHSGVFASLFLSTGLFAGCRVPMKTRTVGSSGKVGALDLKFIQADKTTRDEVTTKLAWMDTGLKRQRLFWGRWYGSSSGAASVDVFEIPFPTASRVWNDHNLFIEFNEKGTVERSRDSLTAS